MAKDRGDSLTQEAGKASERSGESPQGKQGKRNLVAGVLGPAVKLWLRSQVEAVDRLDVVIGSETDGGNSLTSRQMLAGRIPLVKVEADDVVYKGLHLGQLQLVGRDIRMNLGQAVRGKPLKLLAPIIVDLDVTMTEAQLNQSLSSPLLAPQLGEWLNVLQVLLMEEGQVGTEAWRQPQIALAGGALGNALGAERLGLRLARAIAPQNEAEVSQELAIETGLTVSNGNLLQLHQPCWSDAPPAGFKADLSCLLVEPVALGQDVAIERIAIAAGQLHLAGQLTVQP